MTDTIHSCTCPQKTRTKNRRSKLKKTWTGKVWKAKRLAFIELHHKRCDWCGSGTTLTVHHPMRDAYGEEAYMDFFLSGCILLCSKCHKATHVGKVLCTKFHEDGENHYKWHDALECGVCYNKSHPEIKLNIKKKKDDAKALKKSLRDAEKAKAKQWKKEHPVIKYKPGHQTKVAEKAGTLKVPLRQKVGEDSARRKAYKDSGWF